MLYLQNLNDYANAKKKILTAANTAYFTYTPKSQKPHTYLLKGLGNSFFRSRNTGRPKSPKNRRS